MATRVILNMKKPIIAYIIFRICLILTILVMDSLNLSEEPTSVQVYVPRRDDYISDESTSLTCLHPKDLTKFWKWCDDLFRQNAIYIVVLNDSPSLNFLRSTQITNTREWSEELWVCYKAFLEVLKHIKCDKNLNKKDLKAIEGKQEMNDEKNSLLIRISENKLLKASERTRDFMNLSTWFKHSIEKLKCLYEILKYEINSIKEAIMADEYDYDFEGLVSMK